MTSTNSQAYAELHDLKRFILKRHDYQKYNCYDFARDVWLELTGVDIGARSGDLRSVMRLFPKREGMGARLTAPSGLCVFVSSSEREWPHIGIVIDGNAFHLPEGGARFEPLSALSFEKIEFYENFASNRSLKK